MIQNSANTRGKKAIVIHYLQTLVFMIIKPKFHIRGTGKVKWRELQPVAKLLETLYLIFTEMAYP